MCVCTIIIYVNSKISSEQGAVRNTILSPADNFPQKGQQFADYKA